jgi:type II secretory pathway component PulF
MPLFEYHALNRLGKSVTATIDASNAQEVKDILKTQSLIPARITPINKGEEGSFLSTLLAKDVDLKTKVVFTRQLSVMLKAGVPLLDAINLLIEQFEGRLKRILINVRDDLKEGESLAHALSAYPTVFNNIYVQLVKAGEASGKLDTILQQLTSQLERLEEIQKKTRAALVYPIFMLGLGFAIVMAAALWVIPGIANTLTEMNATLPTITQKLLTFSDLITRSWYVIIGAGALAIGSFFYWKSTTQGQRLLHATFLRLPIINQFSRTKAVVQFCNTLGMLMEAGVTLSQSLDIVCDLVENKVLSEQLNTAKVHIIKKGTIAKFLKQTKIFPPLANYMIETGEESGNLSEMLLQVGQDYEETLKESTDALTNALTPIFTFIIGGVVLFIALALFLPILQMANIGELERI